MLVVTGVLLGVVLVVMVGQTARTLQGVGWLTITPIDLELPAWLGIFGALETIAAQVLAAAFVIGSFVLAERMRRPRGRSRPAVGTAHSRERPSARSAKSATASSSGAATAGRAEAQPDIAIDPLIASTPNATTSAAGRAVGSRRPLPSSNST